MGGPRRGAIGLADTKAPMVRGWDPSKSLSAEDGSRALQMGPACVGIEVRACPSSSTLPFGFETSATHESPIIILFA